jgi:peptidoglycan/xylan/chitin deacetylase (PgdA/CDA1 family)
MKKKIVLRRYQIIFLFILLVISLTKTPAYEEKFKQENLKFSKLVALTFDDGPHPYYTLELVRILNKYNIPATFFFVGKQVEKYPEIVKFILHNSKCKVANHTYSHKNLVNLSEGKIFEELYTTKKILFSLSSDVRDNNKILPFFRPPGGNFSPKVIKIAKTLDLQMVLWSVFTNDHTNVSKDVLLKKIDKYCKDEKEIILLHSGIPNTLNSLEDIIQLLYLKGYKFVTVDEIIYGENLSS